jgi:hypothetical protein
MRSGRRRPFNWVVLASLSACLYDSSDRCGANQDYQDGICVCSDGYTLRENECVAPLAPPDVGAEPDEDGAIAGNEDGGRPPYTGQKEPCTSHANCAGFDATYCNPISGKCQVQGCSDGSCDPGYMCVDLGMYIPGEPKVCLDPADFSR